MMIDYLINQINKHPDNDAVVWKNDTYNYSWLKNEYVHWLNELEKNNIDQGSVVAVQGELSPKIISLLIALIIKRCIIVPISTKNMVKNKEYRDIAQVEYLFYTDSCEKINLTETKKTVDHPLLVKLIEKKHPGLLILSSGSTGKSKAAVHDLLPLIKKFNKPKLCTRVIAFLLFDHIGGLNTLFYTLYNAGCLIIPESRSPKHVCEAIEDFSAEALTTTPTFLNLLLLSDMLKHYHLQSLRIINYGTEVMSEGALKKIADLLPKVRLSQAYGLSELGVLPVRSKSSDSLFIKIDGEGFQTRVVDGLLEVKATSSMLGYLNSDNPMTADGWFKTEDAVEVDGEYLRVLGRKSDVINIGGEKVYPNEIENVLQEIQGVEQVSVYSENNFITGQIIVARIKLSTNEQLSSFRIRLHEFCKIRLPIYKIPQKIILTNSILHNERFKKIRKLLEIK